MYNVSNDIDRIWNNTNPSVWSGYASEDYYHNIVKELRDIASEIEKNVSEAMTYND